MAKYKELSGQTFGKFTVIKRVGTQDKKSLWECRCSCGTILNVMSCSLNNKGNTGENLCKCGRGGYMEIGGNYWKSISESAKNRGIKFNLDIKDAWDLYLEQNRKCYLSGLPLKFKIGSSNERKGNQTASLDRLNSNGNYEIGNIMWVYKPLNMTKLNHNLKDFIILCKLVSNHNKIPVTKDNKTEFYESYEDAFEHINKDIQEKIKI